ncbi:methyltransferase family protein [Mumia flava]|uniref:Methyltransferase family protein n=1 Tax=Mumia flava TaxID=1348852 RepID=A0A0B2AXV6_9ACTN|nr:class I SAM-dependent methyltransferase [Mumia flava]PJJ54155.1 methyltransferase family protein [Mumia flava]
MPAPEPRPQMVITGERTVPGLWHENYWFRRHEIVYEAIADRVADRRVLEAGCGEGYGADLLARTAAAVVALDYDAYATGHVRTAYPLLRVLRGNLVSLPFTDGAFDVVVSLQTIEHLWSQEAFLAECVRVLRPGGTLVVSTPNTLTFPPGNPYHPNELDPDQLRALVARHATVTQYAGLRHGARLTTWEREHGSIVEAQIAGPYASWPEPVATCVASVTTADFALAEDDLATSLDLVISARV